jgi:hypothetical protein
MGSSAARPSEQRTKPPSLDGCPMFAQRTWAEKDGAQPFERLMLRGNKSAAKSRVLALGVNALEAQLQPYHMALRLVRA